MTFRTPRKVAKNRLLEEATPFAGGVAALANALAEHDCATVRSVRSSCRFALRLAGEAGSL